MKKDSVIHSSFVREYEEKIISKSDFFLGKEKYQYFNTNGEPVGPVYEDSKLIDNILCFCQNVRISDYPRGEEYYGCGVFDLEANEYIFEPEFDAIGYDEETELIIRCREEDLLDYEDEIEEGAEKGLGFSSAVRISNRYGEDLIDRPFREIQILNAQCIHCVDFKGKDYVYDLQGNQVLSGFFDKVFVYSTYIAAIKGSVLRRIDLTGGNLKIIIIDATKSISPFHDKVWTFTYEVFEEGYDSYHGWLFQSKVKREPRYFVVKKGIKRGLMRISGRYVLPATYDDIEFIGDTLRVITSGKRYDYSVDQIREMGI